ncbi:MAG TPA: 50S ribosomal protein L29 [Myxococcota bacterium]|jgi:large subunit ribosomal protein L29
MKAREFRELTLEELAVKSRELRDDLFNAHVKRSTGQLENTAKLEQLRRDIARVETVLSERRGQS